MDLPNLTPAGRQDEVRLPPQLRGRSMRDEYLYFRPADPSPPEGRLWPLMLFLHGRGECMVHPRTGREQLLEKVTTHGPPSQGAQALDHYFTIVSPQLRRHLPGWNVDDLRSLLDHFAANAAHYQVDPQRVVLAGISIGADGAWNLATSGQAGNDWHVRALALASPASANRCQELREAGLPVWIHHGTAESDDLKACAQGLAEALRKHTTVLSTVVPGGAHNDTTWTPLFQEQIPGCLGFWRWLAYAAAH